MTSQCESAQPTASRTWAEGNANSCLTGDANPLEGPQISIPNINLHFKGASDLKRLSLHFLQVSLHFPRYPNQSGRGGVTCTGIMVTDCEKASVCWLLELPGSALTAAWLVDSLTGSALRAASHSETGRQPKSVTTHVYRPLSLYTDAC